MNTRIGIVLIASIIVGALAMLTVGGGARFAHDALHDLPARNIQKQLTQIDDLEVIDIGGSPGLLYLEDIYATIRMEDGTEITFSQLSRASFNKPDFISISRVNEWHIYVTGCPQQGHGRYAGELFLGQESHLHELFPLPLNNIQDILNNHQTFVNTLEQMPLYPQIGHHITTRRHRTLLPTPASQPRTRQPAWRPLPKNSYRRNNIHHQPQLQPIS